MKNKVLIVLVVVLTVMVILALYHAGVFKAAPHNC